MKLILHVGMHKTGTSSIQGTFHRFNSDAVACLNVGHPNHSPIFITLFREDPENYVGHRRNSRSVEEVMALRQQFQGWVETFIESNPGKDIIASGEDIGLLSLDELRGMKKYFDEFFSDYLIVAYARPPFSLMSSETQQRVAGSVSIHPKHLYPRYRDRLEKFDIVFGRENVAVTKFHPDTLVNGDVIADFADKVNVQPAELTIIRDNVGRSLEATAIMFAQRRLGKGFPSYPNSPKDNNSVVDLLGSIGSTKTQLHPDYLKDILGEYKDDLEWITQRVGMDFVDQPVNAERAIKSREHLIDISRDYLPDVLEVMAKEAREMGKTDPEFIARAVDLLLDMVRARRERH